MNTRAPGDFNAFFVGGPPNIWSGDRIPNGDVNGVDGREAGIGGLRGVHQHVWSDGRGGDRSYVGCCTYGADVTILIYVPHYSSLCWGDGGVCGVSGDCGWDKEIDNVMCRGEDWCMGCINMFLISVV